MENTYLYFQPEYVEKFKCDGAKCHARCCKNWSIFIDKATYEQYSQAEDAEDIIGHIKFDSKSKNYVVTLDKKGFCPFLNSDNLCRLQLEHGEEFLSQTCTTYPRRTLKFGKFFERSLMPSCPVAAELILFNPEPMPFRFVKVSKKVHSNGGKISIKSLPTTKQVNEIIFEIQGAMIAILQERRLSIDQRLIVLGFFLDKLEEIQSSSRGMAFVRNVKQIISSYNPKVFLRNGVPPVIQSLNFDSQKFIVSISGLLLNLCDGMDKKFGGAVVDALAIKPGENNQISTVEVAANYDSLATERKKFLENYSTLLENYLVNEIFLNCYPWRFKSSVTNNFAFLIATYKIFELIIFAVTLKGFNSKEDLIDLVVWFTRKIDHSGSRIYKKISKQFNEDLFDMMESLLDGQQI